MKRERVGKYRAFGQQLAKWRGDRDVATVARLATRMGAKLREPTLRGLEYGWTGSPDPITMMALSSIYEVPLEEILAALVDARRAAGEAIALERFSLRPVAATVAGETHGQEFRAVPLMAARIAAGQPLLIEDAEISTALAFSERFLRPFKRPICVRVGPREESMAPLITPGDVVLLECDVKGLNKPDPASVYAVRVDGGSTLKRVELVREGGRGWLVLLSDNTDKKRYPVRLVSIGEGESASDYLIGRVVWHGQHM